MKIIREFTEIKQTQKDRDEHNKRAGTAPRPKDEQGRILSSDGAVNPISVSSSAASTTASSSGGGLGESKMSELDMLFKDFYTFQTRNRETIDALETYIRLNNDDSEAKAELRKEYDNFDKLKDIYILLTDKKFDQAWDLIDTLRPSYEEIKEAFEPSNDRRDMYLLTYYREKEGQAEHLTLTNYNGEEIKKKRQVILSAAGAKEYLKHTNGKQRMYIVNSMFNNWKYKIIK